MEKPAGLPRPFRGGPAFSLRWYDRAWLLGQFTGVGTIFSPVERKSS
jgi:hypothetical protein